MRSFVRENPGFMEDWYPNLDILLQVFEFLHSVLHNVPLLNVFQYIALFGVCYAFRARYRCSIWLFSMYVGYVPYITVGWLIIWCWDHG